MKHIALLIVLCAVGGCSGGSGPDQSGAPPTVANDVATTIYSFCADTQCQNGGFNYPNGAGGLVQGTNGALYGATWGGGTYGYGSVFGITPQGSLITQYSFCAENGCPDGSYPNFSLALATDGDLYGMTSSGGAQNMGTVFRFTSGGALTTLYSFCAANNCADGSTPGAGLVLAADDSLYGTTGGGGAHGSGTIFRITTGGVLTMLYSFSGGTDGSNPIAPLVQGSDGDLYGTTYFGGASGHGTIFKITLNGGLTTLYSFNGADGGASENGLIEGSDGNFWGTSKFGGAAGLGTIFKMTPGGTLTTLYSFSGPDSAWPNSTLVQGTNGDFYGTTEIGAINNSGTVFKITGSGELSTLYNFTFGSNAKNDVYGGLVQTTDGQFYGTTENGGTTGDGTVFSLSDGLSPFVAIVPAAGTTGSEITILGSDLQDVIGVSFNGVPATFVVISTSEVIAAVPDGASTGEVKVSTLGKMISSNGVFTVTTTP